MFDVAPFREEQAVKVSANRRSRKAVWVRAFFRRKAWNIKDWV